MKYLSTALILALGLSWPASAQEQPLDEVVATGTIIRPGGSLYDPYEWGVPPLGYDEKCGPGMEEECGFDDESGNPEDTDCVDRYGNYITCPNDTGPLDEVVTTGTIIRPINVSLVSLQWLADHMVNEDGYTYLDSWFVENGILPVPLEFYRILLENIEANMRAMMARIAGEIIPQFLSLGILQPMDAQTILAGFDGLSQKIDEMNSKLQEILAAQSANADQINELHQSLRQVIESLEETSQILQNIVDQIGDSNNPTTIELINAIGNMQQAADTLRVFIIIGAFGGD